MAPKDADKKNVGEKQPEKAPNRAPQAAQTQYTEKVATQPPNAAGKSLPNPKAQVESSRPSGESFEPPSRMPPRELPRIESGPTIEEPLTSEGSVTLRNRRVRDLIESDPGASRSKTPGETSATPSSRPSFPTRPPTTSFKDSSKADIDIQERFKHRLRSDKTREKSPQISASSSFVRSASDKTAKVRKSTNPDHPPGKMVIRQESPFENQVMKNMKDLRRLLIRAFRYNDSVDRTDPTEYAVRVRFMINNQPSVQQYNLWRDAKYGVPSALPPKDRKSVDPDKSERPPKKTTKQDVQKPLQIRGQDTNWFEIMCDNEARLPYEPKDNQDGHKYAEWDRELKDFFRSHYRAYVESMADVWAEDLA